MIQRIKNAYREWKTFFNSVMFNFGYTVTAVLVGSYSYIRGVHASFSLENKELYNEYADGLLERGDKSFECFLNQIRLMLPDRWRRHLVYKAGDW